MIKPEYGKPINESTYNQTITFFDELMRLLHPFMPFITEEIWQSLTTRNEGASICVAAYPFGSTQTINKVVAPKLDLAFEVIQQIRNLRNSKGISPKETFDIAIKSTQEEMYKPYAFLIKKLANIANLNFVNEKQDKAVLLPVDTDEVYAFLNLQIDVEAEKAKIYKEIEYLEGFMKSVDTKLSNEKFMANAKTDLVEKERQKKADAVAKIEVLRGSLSSL
jgi:valyl-tRNA synthetase